MKATPKRVRGGPGFRVLFSIIVALAFLFPLYIALVTSLDTSSHVFTYPPHLIPDFDFSSYRRVWHMARWLMYFGNTIVISLTTVAIALVTSVLAAYALSFLRFSGKPIIFMAILVVLMIPGEALLIPNYVILHVLNLLNTYWAQILPYGASVFGVFLLRQFFLTLPQSYWEAAKIDGASHFRFLWSVALPLAKPVLFTVGLYIFIGSWNSFQWPLIVTTSHRVQPIEVAVSRLMMAHSADWRRLSAAGIMATVPLVGLFLGLQRHILRGISRGEGLQE
ncbi:MAG: carbohydrate ABC transporter permease [Sulfobacillus thermosulfidooxidans]|uniref:Carbohydrate ABC transporter permease n=1 Tax=Sulfobacillus thermosulfidooxidans TaxID=28034 RepID=A0A2T2WTM2_SULTH|nr:MAG: carbohydrate ABC transporter permease [Sulfobacillus thermosulfidooxidans]